MIPVIQTKVVVRNSKNEIVVNGNCWAAAIASILELPITEVPNVELFFEPNDGFWMTLTHKFLERKGLTIRSADEFRVFHKAVDERTEEDETTINELKDRFYLVSGDSPRGVLHVTVFQNGKMVHDPHPTRDGILNHKHFEIIEPINQP
jgi:hypothetical protein